MLDMEEQFMIRHLLNEGLSISEISRSDFLRFSARFMLEIDSGLIDLLTKLKGSLRTKKTIKELKKDADLEAMAEIDKKLRRTKNAPN